ncbi:MULTISPECIES: tetratricopeptide repeat protein [Weeksella]|uniref:tetratricopeptide repeat protein n=1 Tax=Weeksella TaxID=1013 RepID=UPI0008A3B8F0|nr:MULTISPECIES: tetratricopeptide repeat protein [Weeksella]MDK7374964.1 tetratricopeptide repeat protein [Weeksella virosa]OFM83847.1 hypothetical protein HMPREF2660_09995 [Weeksella sp. HMSC059D05]
MKKIILSLSFVCLMGSFSFAQDLNTEPAKLAEKVYNDAKKNLALKDISAAAKNLAELSKYENGKVFIVRNKDTKKDEYYYSQAEADAAVAKGNYGKIKSQDLTQKYGILINSEVSTLANETLKSANEALKNKDYKKAAPQFIDVYNLTKALGVSDDLYKYQAAISYYNADDYANSLALVKELIAVNFTGISDVQPKDLNRDLYILGLNNLYRTKTTDPLLDEALSKYSSDADITNLATAIYQQSGNTSQLTSQLEQNVKNNPKDVSALYNLGTLYLQDNQIEKAKETLKQALAVNPNHLESNINMALAILSNEKEYVDKINNNLGTSKTQRAVYEEYTKKRKDAYNEALPYLVKAHELDKNNLQFIKYLISAYKATGNTAKEDEFRALEQSLAK